MLELHISTGEAWNEITEEFVYGEEKTIVLEHSLVSLSKWESKWHKPFLTQKDKTREEIKDYVRFMTITQNVKPELYDCLTAEHYKKINDYISDSMTATWFSKEPSGRGSRKQVTAELIYYWMIANNIPFECQKWHLNRLLTLIKVCNIEQQPGKKMSSKEILRNNAAINAARRAQLNTKG